MLSQKESSHLWKHSAGSKVTAKHYTYMYRTKSPQLFQWNSCFDMHIWGNQAGCVTLSPPTASPPHAQIFLPPGFHIHVPAGANERSNSSSSNCWSSTCLCHMEGKFNLGNMEEINAQESSNLGCAHTFFQPYSSFPYVTVFIAKMHGKINGSQSFPEHTNADLELDPTELFY